uniref:Transposase n=1 Tax=Rhabditophanes sp. KR3021 TaxID=114890 RepID=A0AC35UD41_9BILA
MKRPTRGINWGAKMVDELNDKAMGFVGNNSGKLWQAPDKSPQRSRIYLARDKVQRPDYAGVSAPRRLIDEGPSSV